LRGVLHDRGVLNELQSQLLFEAAVLLDEVVERDREKARTILEQGQLIEEQRRLLDERSHILAERTRLCEERSRLVETQTEQLRTQSEQLAAQRARIEELEGKLAAATAAIEAMERRLLGPKSEKMPSPEKLLRREESAEKAEARRLKALERRRERQALREKLRSEVIQHPVPEEKKGCPHCGGIAAREVGNGKCTVIYEYVPGYFVRQKHVQETVACRCGQYLVTAPPPPRAIDKGLYGPGFVAYLAVMKCADSIPLYRLAKQFQRLGIPMARSTLTDLFHAAAAKLQPLYRRLLALIAQQEIVQADETSMKMQRPNQRGFVWTFLAEGLIAYRFSADRSGETPLRVLGGSEGTLVVDAYTGYNRVTDVEGRIRSGCIAHSRRKFFEALGSAPVEARQALDLILAVYRVEHEAKARRIVGAPEHLALRQTVSRAAMDRFHAWLLEQQPRHPPKGPLGVAIGYALNQWPTLLRFLDDARIPVDNNASERALRVVALGRKNFLTVGHEVAGDHLAALLSLIATCEANDVDPVAYLRDVLLQVDTHPAARIDELLPHKWSPTPECQDKAA
jgi:transposase